MPLVEVLRMVGEMREIVKSNWVFDKPGQVVEGPRTTATALLDALDEAMGMLEDHYHPGDMASCAKCAALAAWHTGRKGGSK
jgi:hypothetical protein